MAEGNKVYDSRGGCNAIIETASNTLIAGCSTTIIPEGESTQLTVPTGQVYIVKVADTVVKIGM